jgi:transposase
MERKSYPTDLSDAEWACLAPPVPAPQSGRRPPKHARREILNAIFSIIRSGEPWRPPPHDRLDDKGLFR